MDLNRRQAIIGASAALAGFSGLLGACRASAAPAQPAFDIRDFGASTRRGFDNGPAIESAARAAARIRGGVYIPEGRFEAGEVRLPAGIGSISGPGWLVGTSAAPEAVVTAGLAGPGPIGALIALNIDCAGRARRGFFARGLVDCRIEGCHVINLGFDGGDGIRLNFPECRGNHIVGNIVELADGARYPAGLFGIQIVGETASPRGGLETAGHAVFPAVTVRQTLVSNNRITGGSHGIAFFGAAEFTCENNECRGQHARNIIASPTCSDGRIANNTCTDAGSSAIHLALGCRRITIADNVIRSSRASLASDDDGAIQAYADCRDIAITGNTIAGDWRYGVYLALVQNVEVANNRIDANGFSGPAIAIESGWRTALPAAARYSRARTLGYRIAMDTQNVTVHGNTVAGADVPLSLAQVGGNRLGGLHVQDETVSGTGGTYLFAFEEEPGMLSAIDLEGVPAARHAGALVLPRGKAHFKVLDAPEGLARR